MGKGQKKSNSQKPKKSSEISYDTNNRNSSSKSEEKFTEESQKISKKNISKLPEKKIIAHVPEKKEKSKRIKKYKLKALSFLNIKPTKIIKNMDISELKKFAHKFDINPEINYVLLSYLKKSEPADYNKYISKYRYTLYFKDAWTLKCFENQIITEMLNEYNDNIDYFELGVPKVDSHKKIISFSRIKLFNLLFFLLKKENIQMKLIDIKKKLLSYSIEHSLVFKSPNKFGNEELKYYTYLVILVNLLIPVKNRDNNPNLEKDFTSALNKEIYFDFKCQEQVQEEEVELEEFYQRKKALENYLKGYEVETSIDKAKIQTNIKNENKESFLYKASIIKAFQENITEIATLKDHDKVLERIQFIIWLIIFCPDLEKIKVFINCLKIKSDQNEIVMDDNNKENLKNIALQNYDYLFESYIDNPFKHKAKYYLYPDLLTKNIIQNDKEIFDSFKNYLKYIYSSKLMKDIFYLTPEFKEFKYPFEDSLIVDELFEITIFLPFLTDSLWGFTIKEIPEILIPVNLSEKNPSKPYFSKMVCQLSNILNTCLHEQIKHYMKALIFYNSFQFGISKRINSNLYEVDEERKLINSILNKNKNKYDLIPLDGGAKAEVFLYGNILQEINFAQSLELLKLSNWDKTIPEHIENFNKYKKYNTGLVMVKLEEITNNQDYCDFFKILAKKFKEYVQEKDDNEIVFDYSAFSAKGIPNFVETEKEGNLLFDYTCHVTFKKSIRDSTW